MIYIRIKTHQIYVSFNKNIMKYAENLLKMNICELIIHIIDFYLNLD
jgi:hypothetical protein